MARNKRLLVRFLVHEKTKRVVLAEPEKDFVDTLLSFLTLPLGTIVRLLGKQSGLGCLDRLYEIVENLDVRHFHTKACKTMLLRPRSAAVECCEHLAINIDDSKPRKCYACQNLDCCKNNICFYSSFENTRCPHCDKSMKKVVRLLQSDGGSDGVFVRHDVNVNFMISDDLHITPSSLMQSLPILRNMDIKKGTDLKERILDVGTKEMLYLLKRSLISKTPLSDLCFQNTELTSDASSTSKVQPTSDVMLVKMESNPDTESRERTMKLHLNTVNNKVLSSVASNTSKVQPTSDMMLVKIESNPDTESRDRTMKLFLNTVNDKVPPSECGEYLTNLVFSFLTLPLGSVIKLLNKNSSIGCVDNLYTSVEGLSLDYIKSEESKSMLLAPKLASFFGFSKQIFNMDEKCPSSLVVRGCCACYLKNGNNQCTADTKCDHGVEHANFIALDPKSPKGGTEAGGGYAKGSGKFLMTEDLCVSSPLAISVNRGTPEFSFNVIAERETEIGETQAKSLLKSALMSKTPLTDVFSRDNKRKRYSFAEDGSFSYT